VQYILNKQTQTPIRLVATKASKNKKLPTVTKPYTQKNRISSRALKNNTYKRQETIYFYRLKVNAN